MLRNKEIKKIYIYLCTKNLLSVINIIAKPLIVIATERLP